MSQHDFEIANQGFPATRADLNNALQALASNSAGTSEPSTTYAYQFWYDDTNDLLKLRNSDNDAWITLAAFDQTNDEWEIRSAVIQAVDSAGVTIKNDGGTTLIEAKDDGSVVFRTDDVTIDTSGNVLMGQTSTTIPGINNTTVGVAFRGSLGAGSLSRTSDSCLTLNRNTTDGQLLGMFKDGNSIGGLSTYGSSVVIGGGDCGVRFIDATNSIAPANVSGNTDIDDSINLGYSIRRFKDLYLSGGVYLGGTGSANKLDDYEYGEWTPTISGSAGSPSVSYSTRSGRYVKVGDMVTVWCDIRVNTYSGGSGVAIVTGIPFTPANIEANRGNAYVLMDSLSFDRRTVSAQITPNVARFELVELGGSTGSHGGLAVSDINANTDVRFQYSYIV